MARYEHPAVVGLRCVLLKISGREPEDLPPDFADRLRALLASSSACDRRYFIASICVRKGCIELTLDIENGGLPDDADDGVRQRQEPGDVRSLQPCRDVVQEQRPGADVEGHGPPTNEMHGGGGGGGRRLELTSADGAAAFAQQVHDAVAPQDGAADAGSSGNVTVAAAAAEEAAAGPAAAPAPASIAGRAPRLARVVHAFGLGHEGSCFSVPREGPAVRHVHPRVLAIARGGEGTVRASGGPPLLRAAAVAAAVAAAEPVGPGGTASERGGASCAPSSGGRGAAGLVANHGGAAEAAAGVTGAASLSLYVELCAPPCVPLHELTSTAVPLPELGGGGGAATAGRSVALVPPGSPSIELLVRCSSRYIPAQIQPAPPPDDPWVNDGRDAAQPAADVMFDGGGGDGCVEGGGGAAASPVVRRSYIVTLLEAPPVGCGILLLDLRWHSRPAQVVPVVLLDERLDKGLAAELSTVVAAWTGPPHELDGLLYDTGAWLRCMAARRQATAAASGGAASDDCGEPSGGLGTATPRGLGKGGKPPYLPILGASLLQFAHAQGLLAMAARLQADMRVGGYTAPFRPLLGGRGPSSPTAARLQALPAHFRPTGHDRPTGQLDVADAAASPAAAAAAASGPCRTAAHAAVAATTGDAGTPAAQRHASRRCVGRLALERQASAVAVGTAVTVREEGGALALNPADGPAEPATAAPAMTASSQHVGSRLRMAWRRCHRRVAAVLAVAEDESYQAFAESYGASVSCLLHLLDLLAFLELFFHLGMTGVELGMGTDLVLNASATAHNEAQHASAAAAVLLRLSVQPPLLLLLALTSVPAAAVAVAWLLLPAPVWRRVAPVARFARHACMVAGRLAALGLLTGGGGGGGGSDGRLRSTGARLYPIGRLGPGALVMEGVVAPAACLLSPPAAALLAALKLPLYVAAGSVAAAASASASSSCISDVVGGGGVAAVGGWGGGRGGAALAECVFRALAVTATALATTLACHALLRQRWLQQQRRQERQQRQQQEHLLLLKGQHKKQQ